ncbi:zinc finger protein 677 [Patella vulgata]|uniref:zinc finger protein 677 n=1 Tax=Patella vulgata TaxID=6465 RepID=UPI00217FB79D|nr:zinc finger protein 677 [Patella vulgata]
MDNNNNLGNKDSIDHHQSFIQQCASSQIYHTGLPHFIEESNIQSNMCTTKNTSRTILHIPTIYTSTSTTPEYYLNLTRYSQNENPLENSAMNAAVTSDSTHTSDAQVHTLQNNAKLCVSKESSVCDVNYNINPEPTIETSVEENIVQPESNKNNVAKCFCCSDCGMRFKEKRGLETHIRSHTGEKPFNCQICQKYFRTKSSLNEHKRTHNDNRQKFICNICEKVLTSSPGLQKHLKSHSGEKPYACQFCEKAFTSASHLKRHERIHTGERPHKCEICNESFTQRGNLKLHARVHSEYFPFKCGKCDKQFRHKKSLTNHSNICNTGLLSDTRVQIENPNSS